MAGEDLKNRVDWLDEERRKTKAALTKLEERLKTQAGVADSQAKQLQDLGAELAHLSARLQPQKLDEMLARFKEESARSIEAMDKRRLDLEDKSARSRALEKDRTDKSVLDLKKKVDSLADARETSEIIRGEQARQAASLQEMRKTLDAISRRDEERNRTLAANEEARRQDIRRMADIQGEQQAARQKTSEQQARLEATETAIQRLDGRLSELMTLELERRNAMAIWQEQQIAAAAERERQWKDWEGRINEPIARMEEFLKRIDTINETHRAMRKTVDEFKELTDRQEQRIREMSEIQRLQEDRLRQDWTTFLGDDQKRWTAQNLTREDEWREYSRQLGKTTDRLAKLEDQLETAEESFRSSLEGDRALLEAVANSLRGWLARTPAK
jgi:DNA repair exonuclease SbcCD ATPase subunit